MTASWLAQMGGDVFVLDADFARADLDTGRTAAHRREVPKVATAVPTRVRTTRPQRCRPYLDWEYGLVDQLERDGTHGFFVI